MMASVYHFARALPLGSCAAALAICGLFGASAPAAEPAAEFLEALRERQYFDVALDYIDRAAKSPLVAPRVKESLPYERAKTLIASSTQQRDTTEREKQLDAAQTALLDFRQKAPQNPLAAKVSSQLGTVLIERARLKVARAQQPRQLNEKPQLIKEAMGLFDEATTAFTNWREEMKKQLEQLKGQLPDNLIARRDELRTDYIECRLVLGRILYEKAGAQKELGDKAATETLLKAAAEEFGGVHKDYQNFLAGQYARLLQGRCYQDIGGPENLKEALSYYVELLELPPESMKAPPVRKLVTMALKSAMECWIADKKFQEAITRGDAWIKGASPLDLRSDDGLQLQVALVDAYVKGAAALPSGDPKKRTWLVDARRIAQRIAQQSGDHQKQAQELLAGLSGIKTDAGEEKKPEPKTFAEAVERAREALNAMQTAGSTVTLLQGRLATTTDAERKAEMQKQIADSKEEVKKQAAESRRLNEAAIRLADGDVTADELNPIRYHLAYLYYSAADYYNAAVMANFIARHYPNSPNGKSCAEIALASYQQLHSKAPRDERTFETTQLANLCRLITEKWPNEPQASKAFTVMTHLLVAEGRLEEAHANLQKIPVESPQRGGAELQTGQAMWTTFLRGTAEVRKARADVDNPTAPEELQKQEARLESLKVSARKVLEDGIERMKKSATPPASMPNAMLFLSQIYVDSGESERAVGLLYDPQFGPLTLLAKKDPVLTERQGFASEAYKAALRAHIANLPRAADQAAELKRADEAMKKLELSFGEGEDERKRLVMIFVKLASELKDLIDLSPDKDKEALANGVERFLLQVGGATTEFNLRNWVAESFRQLGEAFLGEKDKLTEPAKRFFARASEQYQGILKELDAKQDYLNEDMEVQVRLQLARTLRRLGERKDFIEALGEYARILEKRPMALNIQVEAAETYQLRGRHEDPKWYRNAMLGGRPKDPRNPQSDNLIWGWSKLGRITQKYANPEEGATAAEETRRQIFAETFFNSWLRYAECLFERGMHPSSDSDTRKKYLEGARTNINKMAQLYPELGGSERRKEYDVLLRKVQAALKEKVTGLAAAAPAAAARVAN